MKHIGAVMLGRIKTIKKAHAARENGKKGGYWQQKRNRDKKPHGINALYERVENSPNSYTSMR